MALRVLGSRVLFSIAELLEEPLNDEFTLIIFAQVLHAKFAGVNAQLSLDLRKTGIGIVHLNNTAWCFAPHQSTNL